MSATQLDAYAEYLNNAVIDSETAKGESTNRDAGTKHRPSTRGQSANESKTTTHIPAKDSKGDIQAVDVKIVAPASFLRTAVGSSALRKDGWLGIVGSGCKTSTPRSRPSTAPPSVKKLQLTPRPRPPLTRFLSIRRKLPAKPPPKKLKPAILVKKPSIEVPPPPLNRTEEIPKPRSKAAVPGEGCRGGNLKKRKAVAKSKAERIFRDLLASGAEGRLKCPAYIEPSPIPELPGTVCFKGMPAEKAERGLVPLTKKVYVHFTAMASTPVRLAFLKAGFRVSKSPTKWNVLWGVTPKPGTFQKMNNLQLVNHFPGSAELGRKDKLCRNFKAMQKRDSKAFNFMPTCFLLPEERVALRQDIAKHKGRRYIVKPAASACGRGIRITSNPSVFTCAKECVVQRYIQKPMTIDGFKFDLRIYVCVTSYNPLSVYVYEDGLVRFATKAYSSRKDEMDDRYMHITNTSINRRSDGYVKNRDADETDCGSKWSLKAFRSYITKHRLVEWSRVWTQVTTTCLRLPEGALAQIREIVVKTFQCVQPRMMEHCRVAGVPHASSCFEILGFDILLDAGHRAWLLEVNTFPDLAGSSPLDQKLKTALIEDMLHMVGVVPGTAGVKQTLHDADPLQKRLAESCRRGGWERLREAFT